MKRSGNISADKWTRINPPGIGLEGKKGERKMIKAKAEVKVKAAKLRVLAANQRTMAAGYRRQAMHPIYPGQDLICMGEADAVDALAAWTETEADLLDAS